MRQDNQAALDAAFRLTLDFAEVSEHQGWRIAKDEVLAALAAGPGLVALLGPPGTGKTLLLCELARALCAAGRNIALVGRGDLQFNPSTSEVVLVDEAARMDEAALDALALPGVAAVLADLPGLEARLDELGVRVTVVRLVPLRPDEVGAFVADRLARGGEPADLLTPDAVEALAVHSAGVPRVLNLLARAALFMAGKEAAARVEERHVSMAVALREGEMPEMDALSRPPDIRAQFRTAPDEAPPDNGSFEDAETAQRCPGSEAEVLLATPSVDPVAPATPEAVALEPPAPSARPAPPPCPRIRLGRQRVALLAASVLVIASLVAGWSYGPYLANAMRAALALATASPSPAPQAPSPSSVGDQSP